MIALILPSTLFPIGTLLLLLFSFDCRRNPCQAALIVGLCCAVAFYGLRLDSSNDIARHMALLDNYKRANFIDCFGAGHYELLFVWDAWCWTVAQIGDPYLLQSSAAFIGYAIISFIVFDCGKKEGAPRSIVGVALFHAVAAIPILWVVCGIRSSLSLLICALAAYLSCEGRMSMIGATALAFVSVFIHPVSLVAIVLFLASGYIARRPIGGLVTLALVMLSSAAIGKAILPGISDSTNPILQVLASGLEAFLGYSEGNEWTAEHSSSLNTRVNLAFTLLWIAFIVYNIIHLVNRREAPAEGISRLTTLTLSLAVTTISLSFVLESNGTRLIPMLFLLGEVDIIKRMVKESPHTHKQLFVFDFGGMMVCASLLALHVYSVAYGIVSPSSFAASAFFGMFGAAW